MKIQVYGYFDNPFGSIPNVTANWIDQLSKYHDVLVEDFSGQECRFPNVENHLGKHDPIADMGIYFAYPSYMKVTGCLVAKHRLKVGVFVTETDLSDIEKSFLQQTRWDKVCVPSAYCKSLFRNLNNTAVTGLTVVNHGLHECFLQDSSLKSKPHCEPGAAKDADIFTFLYIFQNSPTGGTAERKNMISLLEALKMFRQKGHKANLIIKTSSSIEADISKLGPAYDVNFIIKYMTPEELHALYCSCQAYVNATRAEGFGMTVIEAMSCGLPVVSGIHTGLTEFLCETNCTPIEYDLKKTNHFRYATNDGPIIQVTPDKICNAMEKVFLNYEDALETASMYKSFVTKKFSWDNCLKGFIQWTKELST